MSRGDKNCFRIAHIARYLPPSIQPNPFLSQHLAGGRLFGRIMQPPLLDEYVDVEQTTTHQSSAEYHYLEVEDEDKTTARTLY